MSFHRHLFYIACILLLLCAAHGYGQNLIFDHLTVEDGLSESTILAVTQDSDGFMWFGTRQGLNRYDGRKIRVYRHDPNDIASLSDNFIYSLLADSRGRLWVGTRAGLSLFNSKTEKFRRFYSNETNAASLSDNAVTCMFEDRRGNIWIGTRRGLNLLVEGDSITFLRFTNQPGNGNSVVNNDIHSVFEDHEGALWFGTSHGFSKLIYHSKISYSFTSFNLPRGSGKYEKNNSVNTFAEDHDRLIVGTERSGLVVLDKKTNCFVTGGRNNSKLDSKAIRSILKDAGGNFWIGTIGGLFIANEDFSSIKRYRNIYDDDASLSDNSIRSIFYDRDGSYWIGTFHGGMNIYSPLAKQFHYLEPHDRGQKMSVKVPSAIATDDSGNFWIGTEGNGLIFLNDRLGLKKHFRHDEANSNSLCNDNIKCLLPDNDKGIWIGTIKGLDYYDLRKQSFVHFGGAAAKDGGLPDDVIYDIRRDAEGKLWIATYFGGVARIDPMSGHIDEKFTYDRTNPYSLSSKTVTRLLFDSRQNLWIGTASGLNRKNPDGTFTHLSGSQDDPSAAEYVLSIFQDSRQRVWVGTRGSGLRLLEPDGTPLRHFTQSDGLPGNSIYAMQEDSRGFLWMSTENGLSRFNPRQLAFKNYNRSDGLICKEFNFNSSFRDRSGNFYFGGYNGVAWFHPDSIYENTLVPRLSFTGVRLFNKEIVPDDRNGVFQRYSGDETTLEFRYDQNIFSVEFAVLNFINARKNQFAYRLDGFEKEWNYVKEPIATYMNLEAGDYRLLVKGSNNDGVWNETPRSITIRILPPPWKSKWAYAGYLATFLLLLYAWSRINKKQIRLEHELQLEHIEKVKQDELHQAKLNFFTNIAHEIRTPVTLMVGPIEHLLANHSQNSALKKELTLVKNNTDRLMRLLNQLLDFHKQETGNVVLKVRKGEIIPFVRDIVDSFQEYAVSRKVSLNFNAVSENADLWFDHDELSKVFFNLLVNALKFTPGGGEVNILISDCTMPGETSVFSARGVKILVEDNGLGISATHLEKIFHRFYQAENAGIQDAGFGIGLALTKGIIDLHRGSISVESREATSQECGFTRFTIVLPAGNNHFASEQIVLQPEVSEEVDDDIRLATSENCNTSEKSLILLVEDNDDIRKYLRTVVKDHYEVIESNNGAEGLAVAQERLPDLIVSDVMMPVMDGIDLLRKLKSDERTDHIPVILLTARGTLNHQIEGLEMGADDYLTKPFHSSLLIAKIRRHLQIREKLKEKYGRIVTLQPTPEEGESPEDRFLQKLMKVLEDNIDNCEFSVTMLAREIGMSRPVLFRKTKMLTGLSVIDLIRNIRLKKAEMLLRQGKMSIAEIAFMVGFSDPKYFSKSFRNQYGKPPSQYIGESGSHSQ